MERKKAMENPERIWRWPDCEYGCPPSLHEAGLAICADCQKRTIEYIRADIVPALPRPSDEPLRDAVPR